MYGWGFSAARDARLKETAAPAGQHTSSLGFKKSRGRRTRAECGEAKRSEHKRHIISHLKIVHVQERVAPTERETADAPQNANDDRQRWTSKQPLKQATTRRQKCSDSWVPQRRNKKRDDDEKTTHARTQREPRERESERRKQKGQPHTQGKVLPAPAQF